MMSRARNILLAAWQNGAGHREVKFESVHVCNGLMML